MPDNDLPIADFGTIARVRDALAGGKRALGRDRDIAAHIGERFPGLPAAIEAARDYHRRAAMWAVTQCAPPAAGVIFAGAGLPVPSGERLYSRAAQASPGARFVYVNGDPKITAIIRGALGDDGPRVSAATAPARFPDEVLGTPQARELLALGPVSVHLVLAAHRWPGPVASEAVAGYARLLPSGSSLCMSLGSPDRDPVTGAVTPDGQEMLEILALAGGPAYAHSPGDVASWIQGPDPERPLLILHAAGIADARAFGRPAPEAHLRGYPGTMLTAAAMVP